MYLNIPYKDFDKSGKEISNECKPLNDDIINGYRIKVNGNTIEEIHYNKRKEDLLIGTLKEEYIKDVICCHFNIPELIKTPFSHPMDFKCDDVYFEVKSRRNKHNKYNTTMIGYNKVKWIKDNNIKDVYFVFVFEDGDFYYKYNPEDKFETGIGGRWDRGKVEKKLYYYIPISKLTKF